jgi:hypothetical protein
VCGQGDRLVVTGHAYVKRGSTRFGLRRITWAANAFCVAVAWRIYPLAESTAVTVLNGVVTSIESMYSSRPPATRQS